VNRPGTTLEKLRDLVNKAEFSPQCRWRLIWNIFRTGRLNLQILLVLVAMSTLISQTSSREGRKAMNPSEGSTSLSLSQVVASVREHNPMIQSARAKWIASKERIPQAAAWEDLKVGTNIVLGRFVSVPANAFTDQMVSIEQMIPLSGKNRSKERAAAAEALGAFEEARRQELDVIAKAKASYYKIANLYQLLDINKADEASLVQSLDATRAKFEVGTQMQADVLLADNERQKIIEGRRDLEQKLSDEESSLNVLMNRDPFAPLGRPADSGDNSLPAPAERLRQLVLTNRPEVREAQAKVAMTKAKLELAKREWIPDPTVSLEAERYNAASQIVSQVGAGVSINVPWLNGKKYRAEEREAEGESSAAVSDFVGAKTEALGLLRNQLEKIETLHHHIELYRDNLLPTARQTVASYQADYETDKATLLILLSSQRNLRDLETMYYQDLSDYRVALAELESLVGLDLKTSETGKSNAMGKMR
jgi:cobalt-zinc-cadmium efflux system outer membrane protein